MRKESRPIACGMLVCLGALLTSAGAKADSYGVGNIAGTIASPGDSTPALRIYAFSLDGRPAKMIDTSKNQTTFTLTELPVGRYHVIGYPSDKGRSPGGAVAYTAAAHCVRGPCNHTLTAVQVVASGTTAGVLLNDWYAPTERLPPDPVTVVAEAPAAVIDCEKESTAARRNDCHRRAQEAAEQLVNRHYERMLRALSPYPRCQADLRNAQFAWLKFRDQQCSYEGAVGEEGRVVRCLREMTETRATFLQRQSPVGCSR